jgi:glutamate racemase
MSKTPIVGIFDSGVGGLSVLRALRALRPQISLPLVYFADQAHVPYGPRPLEEVRAFSFDITRKLISMGAEIIVVACNAASAAALKSLRECFPQMPFVGMEPAVKPAAETTHTGVVGVLATPATFQGALYASVVERFGKNVRLMQSTCPGLVQQIEAGNLDGPATCKILESALQPMLAENIDTVVLGCTHYPFVIPAIRQIVGPGVRVIDPSPAVARQTVRLLSERGLLEDVLPVENSQVKLYTSGPVEGLSRLLPLLLLDEDLSDFSVEHISAPEGLAES